MKTNTNFAGCVWAARLLACAGMTLSASAAEETTVSEQPPYLPFTVGLEAGTTGFGGSAAWRFADHFGVRAGCDYFSYSDGAYGIANISYDARVQLLSQPLTFEYYPWKANSFHVSAGIMFNENKLTGTANPVGDINLGGRVFPQSSVGTLSMKVEQQLVNPYLSIGGNFFYFDRGHHVGFGGELGLAYTGEPKVSLTRSGPPSSLIDGSLGVQKEKIKDYARQFQWWPVVKLMVTVSF